MFFLLCCLLRVFLELTARPFGKNFGLLTHYKVLLSIKGVSITEALFSVFTAASNDTK